MSIQKKTGDLKYEARTLGIEGWRRREWWPDLLADDVLLGLVLDLNERIESLRIEADRLTENLTGEAYSEWGAARMVSEDADV